jgi:hypothetical protein
MLALLLRSLGWACLASLMVPARAADWGSQQATAGQHQMQPERWVRTAESCLSSAVATCLPYELQAPALQSLLLWVFCSVCWHPPEPAASGAGTLCLQVLCRLLASQVALYKFVVVGAVSPMWFALCVLLQTCLLPTRWSQTTSRRA